MVKPSDHMFNPYTRNRRAVVHLGISNGGKKNKNKIKKTRPSEQGERRFRNNNTRTSSFPLESTPFQT